ncbi:MAG: hypothetical protein R3A48_18230 [Polyangiales bacterium]
MRPLARTALALALGVGTWLPVAHFALRPPPRGVRAARGEIPPLAEALLAHQRASWRERGGRGDETERMRASCEEWDFMRRTFLVLSLANVALRQPRRAPELLRDIDSLIDDTLAQERALGQERFLMGYARRGAWVQQPPRSVFIDGEVALMLGARRVVRDDGRYDREHAARVALITERMARSPTRGLESYPDECWTFCNTVALAALRLYDARTGADHRETLAAWTRAARAQLTDPRTGMLVSSFTVRGRVGDGPEGSSIFLAAHMLQLVDPPLARAQYALARRALGVSALGFGWAREWPSGAAARADVDSGPTVPVLGANPGASGLALLGAAAFGDEAWLRELLTSVRLAAFPQRSPRGVTLAAGNAVGDAVLLYALTMGPLWRAAGAGA